MVGLGRDRIDNDRDWIKTTGADNCDVGYYVGGTQNAGTGAWTGGTLVGAGNSIRDFGDPWVDENANGRYDQGETFIDLVRAGASAGHWDRGEPNLDSNDPDEQGWYEVQKSGTLAVGGRGTIKQGYRLTRARVRELAYTDPFVLVTLIVRYNAIDAAGGLMLPATDLDRSLNQTRVLDGADPLRRFLPTIDFHEPTVAEFTSVKNGATELVQPGNPVYAIGADLDFTISTPSDNDVLMLQMQFRPAGAPTWTDLSLDPIGDYPLPVALAVADGLPGVPLYDDDSDGLIDFADSHVVGADDTVLCKTDKRENDDDLDGTIDEPGETYYLTTMWAAGLDGKPGNAGVDDDGDGPTDEDDSGGFGGVSDGIFTLGAGPLGDDQGVGIGAGPDGIPGPWYLNGVLQPTDDEWGGGVNNDDYITNDVTHVVFQYRVVDPQGAWTTFATVNGDGGSGTGMVYDYTSPITATFNTTGLSEGLYELRACACDAEGNCNIAAAPIATIEVRSCHREIPLQANR